MPEEICTQEQRIERIEKRVDQLTDDVHSLATEVTALTLTVREQLYDKVIDHDHALNGYKDKPGLISTTERQVEVTDELVKTLRGERDNPGLVGTITQLVEQVKSWRDSSKWLERMVAGAIILALLGLVVK